MAFDKELTKSRFILNTDENSDFFIYPIAKEWWSRKYEYIWASKFTEENDVVLDSACGTGHHFKYHLAYTAKETYCCDIDDTILNKDVMLKGIKDGFGEEAYNTVFKVYDKINFTACNLVSLPYENNKFDKIFCISVLEHLDYDTMEASLKEFNRTLKDNGIVVLTFDYPAIDFNLLNKALAASNLDYIGDVDFQIPANVLESYIYPGLKCVRAILKKK